jgi:carboxylesterase
MTGAEPFDFQGSGDIACLLVHGFTGTPNELRSLGGHLADHGVTTRGVRLSGHGTRPEDLGGLSYRDWLADVERELDDLLDNHRRVFLGGLSMGATLALNVAARRADEARLAGLISLAAPLRLVDWRLSFIPLAGWALRWQSWGRPDILDERQWERHVAYRRFRISALAQLLRLMRETRALLPRIEQPVLIVHSRRDNTVPSFNAELILNSISSQERRLVWLENSYHVMTLDFEYEVVHREVESFIWRYGRDEST